MKRINTIVFLTAVALAAFIAAGCAEQRKIIIKPPEEEMSDIQIMISQIGLKDWRGPLSEMKEKITDQLGRTQYGLKNGNIDSLHGAEIIAKASAVVDDIDKLTESYSGKHPHSAGGETQGGYGEDNGYSTSGNTNGEESMRYRNGKHRGNPVNSDLSDCAKDVTELKDMIDTYYKTLTARAQTTTATAQTESTTTANTR
jgi:hypothetical protein